MEPKETLVNKTLESLNGMEKAKANPFLYGKIMNRMQSVQESRYVKPVTVRLVLVVAVVLIGINVFSLVHYNKKGSEHASTGNAFQTEYFSYLNNF